MKRKSIGGAEKFSGFALILLSAASFGAMPIFARFGRWHLHLHIPHRHPHRV